MRFFIVEEDKALGYSGEINVVHKWLLPGIDCPQCKTIWGAGSKTYPSVDLTSLTAIEDFETARPEPAHEYERLRDLVLPLLPPGAIVEPGSGLGPLEGTAQGRFGALAAPYPWWLMARRDALDALQAEGLKGLKGCRTALRFRQRTPPELLDLEILPAGQLHPECLPHPLPPRCSRCARQGVRLPDERILDAATLPAHLDLFRVKDFSTVIVCSERFVDACQRRGLDGVLFVPLPVR